ncbi:MAG: hypothetical protein HOP12_11825 [Candidatus Eisenbacteria bacterium]|uniref:FlgD/Vpr Ig-like domain-containing protein n=1 Tax=Eiseniibacteriota bacterium TaxID=2212470 RepID=A0A849SHI1_UNCEI|nr:hypothetical protein [Candidatus Eisenbacteria bacterium]
MRAANSIAVCLVALASSSLVPLALSAPTVGFQETWNNGLLNGWTGGFELEYTNPGSGGVGGSGYLRVNAPPPPKNVGTRSNGAEYFGSWSRPGITSVRMSLSDLGTSDAFLLHLSVGSNASLFQHNVGFVPPVSGWAEYVVDLTQPGDFTQIITPPGGATLAQALDTVQVVLIRHDLAPYVMSPNTAFGDFGVDNLQLVGSGVSVDPVRRPPTTNRPVELAPPAPNPARGRVTLHFTSPVTADVTIRIVDAAGRLVRRELIRGASGSRQWVWDGRDDHGTRAPAGVYRAIAASPMGGMSRSFVRID